MSGADHELRPGDHYAGHRIDRAVGRRTYRATVDGDAVALRLGAEPPPVVAHPNVLPVLWTGPGFSVTRWIEGGDLSALPSSGGGLEAGHVLAIAGQVAAALDAAHAQGVVHGGLKPACILLEGDHAWVTGFGGGPAADYAAPEGGPSAAADVYALGAVMWEALAGRPPYLLGDAPRVRDLRPDLPEGLDEVLQRALAPEGRWRSAGALMHAARGSVSRT